MAYPEFHYRWEWPLKSSPQTLWPLVADTNRFNHDARVPEIEDLTSRSDGPGHHRLRASRLRLGSLKLIQYEWDEEPFEWSRPRRFGVLRTYTCGPLKSMRVRVELIERSDGGTNSVYEVWATPRDLLGLVGTPVQVGILSQRHFRSAFQRYDAQAQIHKPALALTDDVDFMPGGRERLQNQRRSVSESTGQPAIVDRLAELIARADDLTVGRLRPYALADQWGLSRRAVLEVCLHATRAGMLDFRWDILCPLCRGARVVADTLGGVASDVHCDTCNIDFNVNFDRSVELTFRPNPSIRRVEAVEFCIAGPQVTPHVVAQQLMTTGEERTVTPLLEPGRYRVRGLQLAGACYFQAEAGGQADYRFDLTDEWPAEEPVLSLSPTLTLANHLDGQQVLIVEHLAWSDQAVTAAEVTSIQLFRDLFSSEALRPGEQISVGTLTVLFTDLRNSTQLYRRIGDASAFGVVMDHFALLTEAVAAEDGALVKTIGDAIMAVFRRPINALRAAMRAQEQVARISHHELMLKAGIHTGPSIAVTLNNRLDYFGTTVNVAARLEGLSHGDDVIISQMVRDDPEVAALFSSDEMRGVAEPFQSSLKGFDSERFDLWRVVPARTLVSDQKVS